MNTGIVKDIRIEAQRLPDSAGVKGMHLRTRRVMPTSINLGYGGVVCRKLRKIGGDWEVSCGTLVGYSENDYILYEDKQNSLGYSLSS